MATVAAKPERKKKSQGVISQQLNGNWYTSHCIEPLFTHLRVFFREKGLQRLVNKATP